MGSSSPKTGAATPSESPAKPIVTPPYGSHQDHSFTLQAIMEMQKSIGELKAIITDNTSSITSMKSKIDGLVEWKNKILGGAIMLGAVIALASFVVTKFSDYITISTPADHARPVSAQKK